MTIRLLYVTKWAPYGKDEAFLFDEIESHLEAGLDVYIAPLLWGPLVHERARELLPRTWRSRLGSPDVLRGMVRTLVRHPCRSAAALRQLITGSSLKLLPRNLAAYPKGLWLAGLAEHHGIQHIHAHWIAVPATMAWVASFVSCTPLSITSHRYDIAQRNLLPLKARHATFVRAIDANGAQEIQAAIPVDARRPIVLHMGVSTPSQLAPVRSGAGELRIVVGARLVPKKGHEFLIQAIARAGAAGTVVRADLFGDGPLRSDLQRLIEELSLGEQVILRPTLSHCELLAALRSGAYDAAVLPSVTAADGDKEGIPVFLMEAMAAGLPVIATPNGGVAELVATADQGVIVPERDVDGLTEALVMLSKEASLRERLGRAGHDRVASSFSISATGSKLRYLFRANLKFHAKDWA